MDVAVRDAEEQKCRVSNNSGCQCIRIPVAVIRMKMSCCNLAVHIALLQTGAACSTHSSLGRDVNAHLSTSPSVQMSAL